jgi:hypothetical protein
MIHQILSYTAALAGIISAGLWWRATSKIVRRGDKGTEDDTFLGDVAIRSTFKAQSKLNAWAAWCTGIAAAAGGVAQLFSN